MITDMLSNKRIKVMLGTNFMDISHVEGGKVYILGQEFKGFDFYPGKIGELAGFVFVNLPYISLNLQFGRISIVVIWLVISARWLSAVSKNQTQNSKSESFQNVFEVIEGCVLRR